MAVLDLPGPPPTLCKEPLSACQAFSSSPMNGLLRAVSQGLFSFWTSKQGPEYRPDRAAIQGLRRETRPSLTPFCEVLPSGLGAAEKMCGLCPSPERIKSGSARGSLRGWCRVFLHTSLPLLSFLPQWCCHPTAAHWLPALTLEPGQSSPFLPHPHQQRCGGEGVFSCRTALASHNTRALHGGWENREEQSRGRGRSLPVIVMRAGGNRGHCIRTPDPPPAHGQGKAGHMASYSLNK